MRYALFIVFMVLLAFNAPAYAVDTIQSLEQELVKLERELPEILKDETDLKTRETYVERVLDLRSRIQEMDEGEAPAQEGESAASDTGEYSGERVLKLTGVTGPKVQKNKTLEIVYKPDTVTAGRIYNTTHGWFSDRTTTDTTSLGYESYPETIVLGEPFSVSASLVRQLDHKNRDCKRSFLYRNGGIKSQPVDTAFFINIGRGKSVSVKDTITYGAPCKKDAKGKYAPVSFGAGGGINNNVKCTPSSEEPYEEGMFIHYKYSCKGAGEAQDIELLWGKDNKDEESAAWNTHNKITLGITEYTNSMNIVLQYMPDMTGALQAQNFGSAEHIVAVNNSDGTDPRSLNEENAKSRERSEEYARQQSARAEALENASIGDLSPHIDYWLKNADPKSNVAPNYNLKYDEWGRLHGTVPTGKVGLAGKPDDAGANSAEYVWAIAYKLDSWNLCALKEYVERKLTEQETESCKTDRPTSPQRAKVPNVRGKVYEEAVNALERAGFKHQKMALEGAPRAEAANTVRDIRTLDDYPVSDIEPMNVGSTFWLIVYGDHKPGDASSSPSNFVSSTWSSNPTPPPTQQPKEQVKPNTGFSIGSLNRGTETSNTSDTGADFKCETGMGHIPVEATGKLYSKRKNGVLETNKLGMKDYICRYNMKGKSRVAQIFFYDKEPTSAEGKQVKLNVLCLPNTRYNRGKAVMVSLAQGMSFNQIGGQTDIDRFINFHVDQIASKAIACGGVVPLEKAEPPKKDPPKTAGTPSQFKCNSGFGLSVDSAASQNGVLKTGPSGEKKYECHYTVQGKKRTVRVEFFDTPQPVTKSYLKNQFCRNFKYSYPALTQSIAVQMVGANITSAVGEKNVIPFYKFHVDQVSPYAIPCNDNAGQAGSSGGGSPKPKGNYYYKQ